MSNQGGLKHAATEPSHLDNKRERRRGAAGRAAALRRAPSDSDCSGETASLSADSGDRAVRPPPPPARSGKSRSSRRRGSEWEVLEGLKDGQRFEKRPEVFNGYLHKKRKWPLKGWHKRFFVVDGGILVYARSPTDVARGRLHGSVDVGLSVISAKARRRRIDIDADEFIYHLRAKTPDVFRTWLNVLKAHRLYRQHLLTFGARESVPKIHAPLEELPPTDTSSRTSHSSIETFSMLSSSEDSLNCPELPGDPSVPPILRKAIANEMASSVLVNTSQMTLRNWHQANDGKTEFLPYEPLFDEIFLDKRYFNNIYQNNGSLCSMNCVKRCAGVNLKGDGPTSEHQSTDAEKQIHSTELDLNSSQLVKSRMDSLLLCECSLNSPLSKNTSKKYINSATDLNGSSDTSDVSRRRTCEEKQSLFTSSNKVPTTTAFFFFTRKKRNQISTDEPLMRKSRKSTNLVKYRNVGVEPSLKKPLSKCMLLGKYKSYTPNSSKIKKIQPREVLCEMIPKDNTEVQVEIKEEKKLSYDKLTETDYDKIAERLLITIFKNHKAKSDFSNVNEIKLYINEVVRELQDVELGQANTHPVKALFKCLLEYWLRNTSLDYFRQAMMRVKSVDRQSNKYFTKDQNLSTLQIESVARQTQFHGISVNNIDNEPNKLHNTKYKRTEKLHKPEKKKPPDNLMLVNERSFDKERRIQELERLLKNTVYICETVHSAHSKEKDIKITKTLIDNLEKLSKKSELNKSNENAKSENSNSSTELPKIQETIHHLISETSIPADVAKEFLSAYLDVLLHSDSTKSIQNSSSQFSDHPQDSKVNSQHSICEVQTEAVQKKVSRSVITLNKDESTEKALYQFKTEPVDPGQLYLKDILDKITCIFSKINQIKPEIWQEGTEKEIKPTNVNTEGVVKDELGRPVKERQSVKLAHENENDDVVMDFAKYDLDHMSMFNEPAIEGVMSLSLKLKEKPPDSEESKRANLNSKILAEVNNQFGFYRNNPKSIFNTIDSLRNHYIDLQKEKIELKTFLSSSDATSKAYCPIMQGSDRSLDMSIPSSNFFLKDLTDSKKSIEVNDDAQCYVMSSLKNNLATKFHSRKKVRLKESKGIIINTNLSSNKSTTKKYNKELSIFEKAPPKIIDEKFILLLLENLSLLSKNLPSLYKDINGLYLKLRKKHDKLIKNTSIQGLSLLGKIYDGETNVKTMINEETQFDTTISPLNEIKQVIKVMDIAINTSNLMETMDKAVTAYIVSDLINSEVQTKNSLSENKASTSKSVLAKPELHNNNQTIKNITAQLNEKSISNPNWYKEIITKDCAMSTIIKCVFDAHPSSQNFRFVPQRNPEKPINISRDFINSKKSKNERKQSTKVKQELIKEISLLSPSFKVSTHSQTDETLLRFLKAGNDLTKDFKVYKLFVNRLLPTKSNSETNSEIGKSDHVKILYRCPSEPSYCSGLVSPTMPPMRGPQAGFVSGTPGGRLASWIIESGGPLENASRELGQAQLSVQQLQRLLDALELQQQVHHDTDVSLEGASPNVKKDRRKFGLRKKKSNNKCASVELAPPHHIDPSTSHMALSALTAPPSPGGGASSVPNSAASLPIACAAARPQSLPGAESLGTAAGPASITSLTPDHQLREDFTVLAKDLVASLKSIVATLVCERGRLRAAMDAADTTATPGGAMVAALRTNLTSALQQNSELRSRLSRIHDASDLAEISSVGPNSEQVNRQFQQSLSYSSSCVSASEFFDAEEHDDDMKPTEIIAADEAGVIELDGDSSSEAGSLSSEEGSASSDNSDGAMLSAEAVTLRLNQNQNGVESRVGVGGVGVGGGWARRTRLPCPRPTPGGPSLWNLLYKNIGKDLSQISMPVTINEPLNMLQRLCEELEYSELLDAAAACASGVERMALVAAFAVSAYAASAHRAASKPFNPLLAETYECVREDRQFRFVAEQVSHHPPISACHAESPRWCFWQEARIKTKFWGKSMEFQPTGRVHVRLLTTGDHYSWNKVTTCVHNLFGGQRWVDQYGDMHITCHGTEITCKLNFIKASSWSSSRHEVRGSVCGPGGSRLRLQGRWSEALYAGEPPAARCLWRPGAMPPEHELYYGFTRFAMELNELEPNMREILPHTDTRLRPDQRALEEGDVEAAEQYKHELEQAQRERRRDLPDHQPAWFRKTMDSGEEMWVFTGEYWKAREAGFPGGNAPAIW